MMMMTSIGELLVNKTKFELRVWKFNSNRRQLFAQGDYLSSSAVDNTPMTCPPPPIFHYTLDMPACHQPLSIDKAIGAELRLF